MTATVTPLLTDRQRQILAFIREFHTDHGYAPSMRQIGAAVGLVSPSSVRHQVGRLQEMGWIRQAPGIARALVVLDPATGCQ